jgi:hypothetical protein
LKGGIEVVSRVRIAAAACLMASGLFVGGASGALAFAIPPLDSLGPDEGDGTSTEPAQSDATNSPPGVNIGEQNSAEGEVEQENPDGQKPVDEKPDQDPVDEKPVDEKPEGEKPDGETSVPGDADGEATPTEEPEPSETVEPTPTKEPEPSETVEPPPPTEEPELGRCEEKSDDDCGPGWPWWPWPGLPPEPGDSDGRAQTEVPAGRPHAPPPMRLPAHLPEDTPSEPATIDAAPGVGVAASEISLAPITLPVIVAPQLSIAGGGAPRSLPTEPVPSSPRGSSAEPPARRQAPAAETGSNVNVPPASYRVGYTDYLRSAGISQVVALAAPGLAGMLVLTGAGGLVGYRQAKAGHAVRAGGTARFVN